MGPSWLVTTGCLEYGISDAGVQLVAPAIRLFLRTLSRDPSTAAASDLVTVYVGGKTGTHGLLMHRTRLQDLAVVQPGDAVVVVVSGTAR